jgi:4'-phosphopantetheinyl transferase
MNVYWFEQAEADVPAENDWLSPNEAVRLKGMRFAKRRSDWRLGRWTAKRALSICLQAPAHPEVFRKMDIRPAASGVPQLFFDSQPRAVTISLSHRNGIAACAVVMAGVEMGCDLEMVEPRSAAFASDYFTVEEQAMVGRASAADRDRLLALFWSAKESALKALGEGLRLDTRCVIVSPFASSPDLNGWSRMLVRFVGGPSPDGRVFHGWWQHKHNVVRTLVASPPPDSPIPLTVPSHVLESAGCRCG